MFNVSANMLVKKVCLILLAFAIVGCASSPYTYHEDPVLLQNGVSKYYLANVNVKLTLGHGAIPGDNTYSNQEELQDQFLKSIKLHLDRKGILALNSESAAGDLEIKIAYQRKFNYGGKALNKPLISHLVNISKNDKKLVSFNLEKYTTQYSYFKEIAVNLEIGAFQWGVEDEPEDVNYISKYIVDNIFKAGK